MPTGVEEEEAGTGLVTVQGQLVIVKVVACDFIPQVRRAIKGEPDRHGQLTSVTV